MLALGMLPLVMLALWACRLWACWFWACCEAQVMLRQHQVMRQHLVLATAWRDAC
jgi:hypothetical protein